MPLRAELACIKWRSHDRQWEPRRPRRRAGSIWSACASWMNCRRRCPAGPIGTAYGRRSFRTPGSSRTDQGIWRTSPSTKLPFIGTTSLLYYVLSCRRGTNCVSELGRRSGTCVLASIVQVKRARAQGAVGPSLSIMLANRAVWPDLPELQRLPNCCH